MKLTRDQLADIEADGDYLNVQDRTSGNVTTYDSSFNAVASTDSVWKFWRITARSLTSSFWMWR